jgi:hypothetical protein
MKTSTGAIFPEAEANTKRQNKRIPTPGVTKLNTAIQRACVLARMRNTASQPILAVRSMSLLAFRQLKEVKVGGVVPI